MFRYMVRTSSFSKICSFVNAQLVKCSGVVNTRKLKPLLCGKSFCGIAYAISGIEQFNEKDFSIEDELFIATEKGEIYLLQLIIFLRSVVLKACTEYTDCLIKEIEIVKISTKVGPIGTHWDQLTEYRVKANELKSSLIRYEVLIKRMEEMVLSSANNTSSEHADQLKPEMDQLQSLLSKQLEEIHKYEIELLTANRDSILNSVMLQ